MLYWAGNVAADHAAKMSRRKFSFDDPRGAIEAELKEESLLWLLDLGVEADWCFHHWPAARRQRRACGDRGVWKASFLGAHDLVRCSVQRWRCTVCLGSAHGNHGFLLLRREPCRGRAHDMSGASDPQGRRYMLLWCSTCGAHAKRVHRALRANASEE